MDTKAIESAFEKMGARVAVSTVANRFRRGNYTVDIGIDTEGEYFFLQLPAQTAQVLNIDKKDRHLLLMIADGQERSRFLCGHDERHWFIAAIPEKDCVKTVAEAKEALKPAGLPKFRPWIRQGEWFFIPRPEFIPPKWERLAITRHESLVRRTRDGRGGKPHIASEAIQHGGEQVWVHAKYAPQGMLGFEFDAWKEDNPKLKGEIQFFRAMKRNAKVYVRGEVRHPDHATLKLGTVWHEVLMNRENESRAMSSMVFLD